MHQSSFQKENKIEIIITNMIAYKLKLMIIGY